MSKNLEIDAASAFMELGAAALRQYIDSKSAFTAHEDALREAAQVRGGMSWKSVSQTEYLIRTSPTGGQRGLGPRSPATEEMYARFRARKEKAAARVAATRAQVTRCERLNRALYVGRAPRILIDLLNRLSRSGLAEHFSVVGTHSIYAYEAAAGVRVVDTGALETNDVDLLWDTRKIVKFVARMDLLKSTFLGLVQKVDPSFELRADQRYTARNSSGFEIDVIRGEAKHGDGHPLQLSKNEDEFWAVQASSGEKLLSVPRFSAVVVAASGHMARMETIHPLAFADVKRHVAQLVDRDPLKKPRDLLQAEIIERLVHDRLPQLVESYGTRPERADHS